MASAIYPFVKGVILNGCLDLYNDVIEAILVDDSYVYSPAHDSITTIRNYQVGSPCVLTVTYIANGVFDADDATFTAVTTTTEPPQKVSGVVIYHNKNNSDSQSMPIVYIDCSSTPITPNGSNITVQWDNGPNKIFAL